jgi:hypothetical protein
VGRLSGQFGDDSALADAGLPENRDHLPGAVGGRDPRVAKPRYLVSPSDQRDLRAGARRPLPSWRPASGNRRAMLRAFAQDFLVAERSPSPAPAGLKSAQDAQVKSAHRSAASA